MIAGVRCPQRYRGAEQQVQAGRCLQGLILPYVIHLSLNFSEPIGAVSPACCQTSCLALVNITHQ